MNYHFLTQLAMQIHDANVKAGWWTEHLRESGLTVDLKYGWQFKYVVMTKLALVHSEVSEALEGMRKNLMDDKLPHRKMGEVELADAIIRILDLCGALGYDIGAAVVEKLEFNSVRPDHKVENRLQEGGKAV